MPPILLLETRLWGEVLGNFKINGHLVLQSTAKITGDIACAILRVEDGAQFSGKCVMNGKTPTVTSANKKPVNEEIIEEE